MALMAIRPGAFDAQPILRLVARAYFEFFAAVGQLEFSFYLI